VSSIGENPSLRAFLLTILRRPAAFRRPTCKMTGTGQNQRRVGSDTIKNETTPLEDPGLRASVTIQRGLTVLALVRRARRRILHNLLFYEGANAASAALCAFILLLVIGTQVLNWYWALLLPGAAVGLAVWRVRRRLPSLYVTAQRVDRRMQLADALSTALYFGTEQTTPRPSSALRDYQRTEADRVATGVDPRQAVPYVAPRSAYITAVLLLVASSLFGLRYGLTDRLDLKQPLAFILRDSLGLPEQSQRARLDPRKDPNKLADDDPLATDQGQPADSADQNQPPEDSAENTSQEPQKGTPKADPKSKNSQSDADNSEDGQADQSEQPLDSKQNANSKDGQKDGKESQSGNSPSSQSQQNNQSLLSKMKEAMQNLLSSMQQNPREQQQNASNQMSKGGKSQQNQGKQQAKGEKSKSQSGDSQDQQSADEGQEAQNSPGQSADQQDSPLANKQPGSGAGNRDGAKDVRQAEQLAAMGKISEIIGKRAANVTGEATVDVENTSQQLRTGYQDRRGEHSQTGAEIHRDEIPVALESYVEQYFEQVRKQPAPKEAPKDK
jgi:hypothetical protein